MAALINEARPDEVVPLPGTAAGINTAAISLSLRTGNNELVVDGDYPPVIYPKLYRASEAMGPPLWDQPAGGTSQPRSLISCSRTSSRTCSSSVLVIAVAGR